MLWSSATATIDLKAIYQTGDTLIKQTIRRLIDSESATAGVPQGSVHGLFSLEFIARKIQGNDFSGERSTVCEKRRKNERSKLSSQNAQALFY